MKFAFASLFLICWFSRTITATCYNPDGSEAVDSVAFQPCNQIAGSISQCCGTNWSGVNQLVANDVCQPNGLCLNSLNDAPLYWRSSCTDKTWQSPFCLKELCTDFDNGGNSSENVAVLECADGSWCCGGSNTTCCQEKLGVQIPLTIGVTSTSTASSTLQSSTSILQSSTSMLSTSSAPVQITTSTSSPSPSPPTPANGLATGAKIGIAIGAGFLVIIIGLCIWMLHRHHVAAKTASLAARSYLPTSNQGPSVSGIGRGPALSIQQYQKAGFGPRELPGDSVREVSELGGMQMPAELSAVPEYSYSPRKRITIL
ncbi:hypothetical protein LSUB1_G006471 [Lachnellula subtilissima]|uniref:Mid2 domain-containing protein n=1 Tax=Lachnellula subtilissima TaxID=602034 RepID=A0A8H8RJZ9_9HELO|nr:hypothetical protein LSUB1_G006471 [Lachnellula subtilissima]